MADRASQVVKLHDLIFIKAEDVSDPYLTNYTSSIMKSGDVFRLPIC